MPFVCLFVCFHMGTPQNPQTSSTPNFLLIEKKDLNYIKLIIAVSSILDITAPLDLSDSS